MSRKSTLEKDSNLDSFSDEFSFWTVWRQTDGGISQRGQKAFMVVYMTGKEDLVKPAGFGQTFCQDCFKECKWFHKDSNIWNNVFCKMSSVCVTELVLKTFPPAEALPLETSLCWCWTILNETQSYPGSEQRHLGEPLTQVWFLIFNKHLKRPIFINSKTSSRFSFHICSCQCKSLQSLFKGVGKPNKHFNTNPVASLFCYLMSLCTPIKWHTKHAWEFVQTGSSLTLQQKSS